MSKKNKTSDKQQHGNDIIGDVRQCVCPKCRGKDLILKELWKNHAIEFDYKNGEIIGKGVLTEGEPFLLAEFT